jgi:hypothetical protein
LELIRAVSFVAISEVDDKAFPCPFNAGLVNLVRTAFAVTSEEGWQEAWKGLAVVEPGVLAA